MSEMPHCLPQGAGCKMLIHSYFRSLRITEVEQNRENSHTIMVESNAPDSGLILHATGGSNEKNGTESAGDSSWLHH